MTSYIGISDKEISLLDAFREALLIRINEKEPDYDSSAAFAERKAQLEIARDRSVNFEDSRQRKDNWSRAYEGFFAAEHFKIVFEKAAELLNQDDILECRPEALKSGEIDISTYQMEKIGLVHLQSPYFKRDYN